MLKKIKLLGLSVAMFIPVLSGCSSGSPLKWNVKEEDFSANAELTTNALVKANGIDVSFSSETLHFSDSINKDQILINVLPTKEVQDVIKVPEVSDDGLPLLTYTDNDGLGESSPNFEPVSLEYLIQNRFTNFDYSLENQVLKITVSKEYINNSFTILLHNSCVKENVISYSEFSYYEEEKEQVIDIVNDDIIAGESNPTLIFSKENLVVKDFSLVNFDLAFIGLKSKSIKDNGNYLSIETKGVVEYVQNGSVTFEPGFFDGVDNPLSLYFSIDNYQQGGYASSDDVEVNDDTATINIQFVNFVADIEKEDISTSNETLTVTKFLLNDENVGTVELKYVDPTNIYKDIYEALDGLVLYFSSEISGNFSIDLSDVSIHFYTVSSLVENDLFIDVFVSNGKFTSNNPFTPENLDFILDPHSEISDLWEIYEGATKVSDNNYRLVFDASSIGNLNFFGEIVLDSAEIKSNFGDKTTTLFYQSLEFFREQQNSLTLEGVLNDVMPNSEESYRKVMDDQFPWLKLIEEALKAFDIGGKSKDKGKAAGKGGKGAGAAKVLKAILKILSGLLDEKDDPLAGLREELARIRLIVNDINRSLAEFKNDMKERTEEIYRGVNRVEYMLQAGRWESFTTDFEKMLSSERSLYASMKNFMFNWIHSAQKEITVEFSDIKNSQGSVTNGYGVVVSNYNPDGYSTDDTKITKKITFSFDVKNAFPSAFKCCETRYNSAFTENFVKDIQQLVNQKGFTNEYLTVVSGNEYYADYQASFNKDSNSFATDLINTLFQDALKDTFPNTNAGADKAVAFTNQLIELLHSFSGMSQTGGSTPKYEAFYNMLKNKYSFQNEIVDKIKAFRMNIKDQFYRLTSVANIAINLFPGIDITKDLQNAYDSAFNAFKVNDGLINKADKFKDRTDIYSFDYCYVTNTFVSMNLVLDYVFPSWKSVKELGAVNRTMMLKHMPQGSTYVEIDMKQVNLINKKYYDRIFERRALNNSYPGLSFEDYLIKVGVLDEYVKRQFEANKVNERRIIFNYTGLSEINLNNYNTNAYGVCKEKLYKGANYFNLGQKYWMLDFKFGRKENYYCWKVGGEVYDLNTNTKLRDTIGHVWWYKESHWYWFFNDEIWGFQEEGFQNGWQFYYAMFNC